MGIFGRKKEAELAVGAGLASVSYLRYWLML